MLLYSSQIWSFDGTCLRTLKGHANAVTCLEFDSQRIVTGSVDCTLKFWDMSSGECSKTIDWRLSEGHTDVVRCGSLFTSFVWVSASKEVCLRE